MFRIAKLFIIVAAALALLPIENVSAITRTTRTLNFVEFYAGSSMPQGTYTGLPDYDFIINGSLVDVDAKDVYDNSYHFGLSYGQLRGSHLLFSLGFKYTKHDVKNIIPISIDTVVLVDSSTNYNQFDLDFNLNYMITDITKSPFAPYVGIGVQAGLLSISGGGFQSQNEVMLGLRLNFGGDLKIWSAKDGTSLLTLSSINSYDFYGSNQKPKYLNLGVGLRYYFRP
ncbi:MAG: hypothetical protein IID63_04465 [candidate division Zixibacteria bacterium]|nr:hypothetical protein [candidate division Zixibacteria bacterium]